MLSGLSSVSGLRCLVILGTAVSFGSHHSTGSAQYLYAQKYTSACHGGTEAMKIGSLRSNRVGQDDCGQCQQDVLSFPALTDLQLELKYYMVL